MKKQFDAVGRILPHETFDMERQDLLSQDCLGQDTVNRIVQKTLTQIDQVPASAPVTSIPVKRKRCPRRWLTAIIAAVLLIITSVSVTAEVLQWDYRVSKLLHVSETEMISLQGMNIPVTQTVRSNGVVVSFGTAISDGYTMYLPAVIRLPKNCPEENFCAFLECEATLDGKRLDGEELPLICNIDYPPIYQIKHPKREIPILIKITPSIVSSEPYYSLDGRKLEINFKDLAHSLNIFDCFSYPDPPQSATENTASLIKGTWKVSLTLPERSEYTKILTPERTFLFDPHNEWITSDDERYSPFDVTVESIRFSPVSFNIVVSVPEEKAGKCATDLISFHGHLKIRFKDGSIYTVNELANWPKPLDNNNVHLSTCGMISTPPVKPGDEKEITKLDFTLKKIIDINEVEAILIDDEIFPVE
ncbi:MAG: DUF4179 domain-containing protein [Clostridiales bacterium]|nr:DUF4179 domain-containing protein [Clostridiales bacterium]